MKINSPENAPKNTAILADFGGGLEPAVWSEWDRAWITAHVAIDAGDGPQRGICRWFETNAEENGTMRSWMPIPSTVEIDKNFKIIKQLVDALESARDYAHAPPGDDAIFPRKDLMQDLENIDGALSAGHDFLRDCNPVPPLSPQF